VHVPGHDRRGARLLNTPQHLLGGKKVGIQHCAFARATCCLFGEVVKLGGFGLASVTTAPFKEHRRAGKMDYTAPEVIHGKAARALGPVRPGRDLLSAPQRPLAVFPRRRPPSTASMFAPPRTCPSWSRRSSRSSRGALSANAEERWPSCKELILRLGELFPLRVNLFRSALVQGLWNLVMTSVCSAS